MAERTGDVVYTPDWVAKDMVDHFVPTGRVLDPCAGAGAFLRALPEATEWCEIDAGRDFFAWAEPVDWVIGNPPYSLTRKWFEHSYTVAENLCYLVPLRNVFSGYGFIRDIHSFGGIREIRVYGTGNRLGFPMGNAIGAFHIQRGWLGPTQISLYDDGIGQLALTARPDREPLWRGTTVDGMGLDDGESYIPNSTPPIPLPPGTAVRVDKDTT